MRNLILILWEFLGVYAVLGLIFAAVFHAKALARLDPAAGGAGFFFRALITPGIVALWPVLAWKWRRGLETAAATQPSPQTQERLRAGHALAWSALATLIPVALAAAIWFRPRDPAGGESANDKVVEAIIGRASQKTSLGK